MANSAELNKNRKALCYENENSFFYCFLVMCLSFPFLLELFLNRNTSLFLPHDNWISFLGSYVGGALGGLGTLFAVYITIKETRKIQEKTLDQIEKDREIRRKNERKIFADEVAKDVSKYIANICVYFYDNSREFYLQENKKNAQAKLNNIDCNLESSPEAKQEEDLKKLEKI